jgi:hypothetical protein
LTTDYILLVINMYIKPSHLLDAADGPCSFFVVFYTKQIERRIDKGEVYCLRIETAKKELSSE